MIINKYGIIQIQVQIPNLNLSLIRDHKHIQDRRLQHLQKPRYKKLHFIITIQTLIIRNSVKTLLMLIHIIILILHLMLILMLLMRINN